MNNKLCAECFWMDRRKILKVSKYCMNIQLTWSRQLSGGKDTVHKNRRYLLQKIVCIWSSKNLSGETASFYSESHESLPYKGYFCIWRWIKKYVSEVLLKWNRELKTRHKWNKEIDFQVLLHFNIWWCVSIYVYTLEMCIMLALNLPY